MRTLYERRVEQEWRLLQALAQANPGVVEVGERRTLDGDEVFAFRLLKTEALVRKAGGVARNHSHLVTLHFPRFFPAMPLECTLNRPVFHPNVHPETGFVCLWNRATAGDTVVEAVAQLQRVITWQLVNREADHLMQPSALAWLEDPPRAISLPLACQAVCAPEAFAADRSYRRIPGNMRRRLS